MKRIDFKVANLHSVPALPLAICVTLSPFSNLFEPQLWPRLKEMKYILQGYHENLIKRKKKTQWSSRFSVWYKMTIRSPHLLPVFSKFDHNLTAFILEKVRDEEAENLSSQSVSGLS